MSPPATTGYWPSGSSTTATSSTQETRSPVSTRRSARRPRSQLPTGAPGARILGLGALPARRRGHQRRPRADHGHQRRVDPEPGRHRRAPVRRRGRDRSSTWPSTAGGKAIAAAAWRADDIDTVHRRDLQPCPARSRTPAPRSRSRLGIPAPGSFDLNAACAGFCYAPRRRRPTRSAPARPATCWSSARRSSPTGPTRTDRATAIIFADGAGAAVVGAASRRAGHRPGRLGQRRRPWPTPSRSPTGVLP